MVAARNPMNESPLAIALHYTIPAGMHPQARVRILEAYGQLLHLIAAADEMPRDPVVRTAPILVTWDRGHVLQQIEEATRQSLTASDSLPDSLIASAQALGLQPYELGVWIYEPGHDFQTSQLAAWARRNGFGNTHEADGALGG